MPKNKANCTKNLNYYLRECSENTTIHGIRFLCERRRSRFEKISWLIFIGFSIYCSLVLILKAYRKWERSPVIVTYASYESPIWKIPFPAVTVCSNVKNDFGNFLAMSPLDPEINYGKEDYLKIICPKAQIYENSTTEFSDEIFDYLMTVTPNFDLVTDCLWMGRDCGFPLADDVFKTTITSEGVCQSFNILDREELFTEDVDLKHYENFSIPNQPPSQWFLEKGYTNATEFETFPFRTIISGIPGGLELIFRTEPFVGDFICDDTYGYKVVLHNPSDVPNLNQRPIRIGMDQDISVVVKPNMVTTSENLRMYTSEDRMCYFSEEKHLGFFKIYTQANCLLECLTNFTYRYCGCVNFFMPRNTSMPICGLGKLACLKSANQHFLRRETGSKSQFQDTSDDCHCLPSCYSLSFDTEISQSTFKYLAGDTYSGYFRFPDVKYSRIQIFFKDMQFLTSERNELYGQADFLASCGGLLGLFIGFSSISIVEIFYFASLRIICNCRRYGTRNWSAAEELLEN